MVTINIFVHMVGQKLVHMGQKHVWKTWTFFKRRGHLTPTFNIIFIFRLNNFFGKSAFSGETAKNCLQGTHFGSLMCNYF